MRLPALYHWSPQSRRKQIDRYGLRPGSRPTVGSVPAVTGGVEMVCLAPSPSSGWGLSGGLRWVVVAGWDLWQVELVDTDEVHILPGWGPLIREVRVANRIPKSRLWWIGERTT